MFHEDVHRQEKLLLSGKFRHAMQYPEPLVPLMLDRVMEGRAISAQSSRLLSLPVELLFLITQYIAPDRAALANLAFVNSDCRQMARSCQYTCLALGLNERTPRILYLLRKEIAEKLTSRGQLTRRPSLGACVSHLKVDCYDGGPKADPRFHPGPGADLSRIRGWENYNKYLEGYYDELSTRLVDGFEPWWAMMKAMADYTHNVQILDERAKYSEQAKNILRPYSVQAIKTLIPDILAATSGLPHLRSLSLLNCCLSDDLVDSLMRSSVTHLRIFGTFKSNIKLTPGRGSWRLESLGIGFHIDEDTYSGERLDISPSWGRLLSQCCSTLRFLKLEKDPPFVRPQPLPLWFNLKFPNLRTLLLFGGISLAPSALACLLKADLHTLRIQYCYGDTMVLGTLDRVRRHPTLETLVVEWLRPLRSKDLDFIRENAGIRSLVLTTRRIPLFDPAFNLQVLKSLKDHKSLRLLSLNWHCGSFICKKVINELGTLTSIEVLHLNMTDSAPEYWRIDHTEMSRHLSPLANLRRLIFEGNSNYYRVLLIDDPIEFSIHSSYDHRPLIYEIFTTNPPSEDGLLPEPQDQARMLRYAEPYIDTFPKLEFVHVGRLLIKIKKDKNGQRKPFITGISVTQEGGYDFARSELGLEGPALNEWYVEK